MNWRGRPLTSHEVIVETIAATTTSTGLTVRAALDDAEYPKGVTTDKQIKALETQGILHVTSSTASGTTPSTPNRNTPETDKLTSRLSVELTADSELLMWSMQPRARFTHTPSAESERELFIFSPS